MSGTVSADVLAKMKAPNDFRAGVWRGRVLQIKVTNYCDLDCKNCSVGVGLAKKLKRGFYMSPDQFREACRSLAGYAGVVGMFGGNPCIHPNFEELCSIFRQEIPNQDQRGLWSNRLFGHGAACRETFGPYSNLNVHGSREAWDEIKRDWPEAEPIPEGLARPSMHGSIFGSPLDLGVPEPAMWDMVGKCYINQTWSAEITLVEGELQAYFCEIAATMAELEGDGRWGYSLVPGWWQRGMKEFEGQVNQYCRRCLVPLNPRKSDAAGSAPERYTEAWSPVLATIKGRPLQLAMSLNEVAGSPGDRATAYLK